MNRWPIIFVIFGVLASCVAYDRLLPLRGEVDPSFIYSTSVNPAVTEPPRLDGAWFCPVGSSSPDGLADHRVNITNFSQETTVAFVQILTGEGRGPTSRIEVAGLSTQHIYMSDYTSAESAAAVVELIGGDGAVSHTVYTAMGPAEGQCATEVSSEWYFSSGRTKDKASNFIALMNPFNESAVYDLAAVSNRRERTPRSEFVEPRSVKLIDINEIMSDDEYIAVSIKTTQGRLVAERLQMVEERNGPRGVSLHLGVTNPSSRWVFVAGQISRFSKGTNSNELVLFNPAATGLEILNEGGDIKAEDVDSAARLHKENTVTVDIDLWPSDPADISLYGMVTVSRDVGPGRIQVLDLATQVERMGLPLPYGVGVSISTQQDDHYVVAERWQAVSRFGSVGSVDDQAEPESSTGENTISDTGSDILLQPVPSAGLATSTGHSQASTRWVIPWVTFDEEGSVVLNVAGSEDTSVEISRVDAGALHNLESATLKAFGRLEVAVESQDGGAALLVVASEPVVVDATIVSDDLYNVVAGIPTVGLVSD